MMNELSKELTRASEAKAATKWTRDGMTPVQVAEADALERRITDRPARPAIKFEDGEAKQMVLGDGGDASAMLNSMRAYDVSGSGSSQFVHNMLNDLARVLNLKGNAEDIGNKLGAAMALIGGINPQNELEATMAMQMVAANEAALTSFARARSAEYLPTLQAHHNHGAKAMRAFALHAETLAKLRRNGEQVVKHVHVGEGGQAVIAGTFNHGGGGDK